MSNRLRVVRGDTSGRTTKPTAELPSGTPKPPTNLSTEGKAEWRRVVPLLEAKGFLSPADRAILTMYCDAWAVARETRALLDEEGFISNDRDGVARKHPAYQVWRESTSLAAQLAKELFLTPAARVRTPLPERPDAEQTAAAALID